MLVTLQLWKERNTRTFNNVSTLPIVFFEKIKSEARTWVLAGAKHLCLLDFRRIDSLFNVGRLARSCSKTTSPYLMNLGKPFAFL
jgi:hypothetical protein